VKRISRKSAITATVLALLTISLRSSAQDPSATNQPHRHPRYKFVDLGTFGGPGSINNAFEQSIINSAGTVVGGADTTIPDPYFPNCFTPNCVVQHAFKWQSGVLHDLGALPGTNSSYPFWINERGWVAGGSQNGTIDPLTNTPASHAVLWKGSEIINLGTLGGNQSTAWGVNNEGQVTGFALNTTFVPWGFVFPFGTQERAFLWQNGHMKDLGTLGGPSSVGLYINDRGHVSGASYRNDIPESSTGTPPAEPFLWDGKKMVSLGSLGGVWGQAWGMNNRDQVIGNSSYADAPGACLNVDLGCHAVLWDRGVLHDLGTLGGTWAFPTMLNERGDVVGGANTFNDQTVHAVRWRNGVIKDLGGVDGDPCGLAYGQNNKGQIVGISVPMCDLSLARAFLWEDGEMIDLNARIPATSNFQMVYGHAINERGEITGIGVPAGISPLDVETLGHAFLLIPCGGNEAGCEDSGQNTTASQPRNPAAASVNSANASYSKAPETLAAFRARILARQHHGFRSLPPK
jgi:probable HAF family extracellular repeat protein